MSKREEFHPDDNFDFDPNEILDDDSGSTDVDFDFLNDLPELNKTEGDELDDILSSDFLSMLGMEPKEEPDVAPVAEEPVVEEPVQRRSSRRKFPWSMRTPI